QLRCSPAAHREFSAWGPRLVGAPARAVDRIPEGGGQPLGGTSPLPLVRDAHQGVDRDAMLGGDRAHAWSTLLAQRGLNRGLDVGSDLGSAELLSLVLGPPQARAHPFLYHGALEL